ncbi:MAG: TSUP family transporter, partial [Burkholderiales bacterium]|nr:TSUP family transporter [Burkholderiales bacterium]
FLILAPQEPIRLLLALMIFAYLCQQQLARLDWSWLARHPRWSAFAFGMTGGFFSGSVNNSLPPLLIYFMLLGVETTVMTQILNLCFLGGKMVQAATLGAAGEIRVSAALANIPLTLIALAGMVAGMKLQARISAQTYGRLLRRVLFAIALLLIWQALRGWLPA